MGPTKMHSYPSDQLEGEVLRLRRLASGLLYAHHGSDDVVQEAWLAALRAKPQEPSVSLGAWLSGAVKKLARQRVREEARRSHRERRAARPEAVEATDESSARLELSRRMFEALDELEEPYRTVIALRFLEELPPREIARRTHQPVNTVRTQLRRGLERLRARLDAGGKDGRASLLAALAPLAGTPPLGSLLQGPAGSSSLGTIKHWTTALFMSNKLIAAGLAALVIALSTWTMQPSEELSRPGLDPGVVTAGVLPKHVGRDSPAASPVEKIAGLGSEREVRGRSQVAAWSVEGLARGVAGAPVAGLPIHVQLYSGYDDEAPAIRDGTVQCDDQGRFAWSTQVPEGATFIVAECASSDVLSTKAEALVLEGESPPGELIVSVKPMDVVIAGRVINEAGEAIESAEVEAFRRTTLTDAEGRYELRSTTHRKSTRVQTRAQGYASQTTHVNPLQAGSVTAEDITLVNELIVRGRVQDESGSAVEGARVRSGIFDYTETETDVMGRFALGTYDQGEFRASLYIRAPGYAVEQVHLTQEERVEEVVVTLRPAGRMLGRVVDAQGHPIEAARICVGNPPGAYPQENAWSDRNGEFEIDGLSRDPLPYWITRTGFAVLEGAVTPLGGESDSRLVLKLVQGHRVGGRVLGEGQEPLEGVLVYAGRTDQMPGDGVAPTGKTDKEGRFLIPDLEQATYRLGFLKAGYARLEVEDVQLDLQNHNFQLQRGGKLAGRVVDGVTGDPVPAFEVRFVEPLLEQGEERLWGYWSGWSNGMDFVDTDGYFRCEEEDLQAGHVIAIEVRASGYAVGVAPHVVTVPDPGADDVLIQLYRGSTVEGRVVDAQTSAPLRGVRIVRVTERVPVRDALAEESEALSTTTDERGEFVLENVPSGSMSLAALHDDWCTALGEPFEVLAGGARVRREISLSRGASITVQLSEPDGTPVAKAGVALFPKEEDGQSETEWEGRTDRDGRFVFEHLLPGEYQVSWTQKSRNSTINLLSAAATVGADEQASVVLRLRGTASVSGSITLAGREDLPKQLVVMLVPTGESKQAGLSARAEFASEGQYEFRFVEAGSYRVSCYYYPGRNQGYSRASEVIEVKANGTVRSFLDLEQQ